MNPSRLACMALTALSMNFSAEAEETDARWSSNIVDEIVTDCVDEAN
jgi:hypothetical protein